MRLIPLALSAAVAAGTILSAAPARAILICVTPNDDVQVCDGANTQPECVYGHVGKYEFALPTC